MKFEEIVKFVKDLNLSYNGGMDINFFLKIILICEKNKKFLQISEYETSIPFDDVIYPRFIHYTLYHKDYLKNKDLGLLFSFRGPEILRAAGLLCGSEILKSFIKTILKNDISIPYTIVSVEFEKNKIKKFTEYFCFREVDFKLARILSDFIAFSNPRFIYKNSRNITFIGVDYFPENNSVLLKLYNKWKFDKRSLVFYERKFIEKYSLNYIKDFVRTTYIYPNKKYKLNKKTHFIFYTRETFFTFFKNFKGSNSDLMKKLEVFDRNKIVISIDKKGLPLEVYFK